MIVTPTFEGIVNSFIENLRTAIPEASTSPISVIREALINPTASQLSALYSVAQRISVLQNIFEATGVDLDNLAATYNITRRAGTPSFGSVVVDLSGLLVANSITIPAGTILRTVGSESVTFNTLSDAVFNATDRANYESAASAIRSTLDSIGYNAVSLVGTITIQSTASGFDTNVGAFTINSIITPGITRVTNLSPTAGGADSESDNSLRSRIAAVFTGNSIGTQSSLLAAALGTVGVTSGFLVKSGDPLMTRDGSVFDSNGSLITPGSGRSVDIYVQGVSLSTNSESPRFITNNTNAFLSDTNSVLVGQPTSTGVAFGFLPIFSISSMSGTESGATFVAASTIQDSEENILFEGNFALINDVDADKYSIVQNLITGERKLALFLSPLNTTYTVVEKLTSSKYANSSLSRDRILFLQNTVTVSNENAVKGIYGGSDQLKFSNVSDVSKITEQQTITEVIQVTDLLQVPGGVGISVRNRPIVSIISATNTRLGTSYATELLSATEGTIRLIGRFPPRSGDYIQVEYVWENSFTKNLHFSLSGDLIDWSVPNKVTTDATLLPSTTLDASNTLAIQPPVPSKLKMTIEGISDREIVQSTLTGTIVDFVSNQLALTSSTSYRYSLTGLGNIGKLLRVSNISQGFDYNLTGYKLKSNKFDSTISVDATLLPQQFQLSSRTNAETIVPGDKILLARPSQTISLSSATDFENNISGNIAPIFDPTQLDFTAGGVILKSPLLDSTSTVTTLSGLITQNLELSGLISVTGDLVISEGVLVTIAPSTVIQVTPSSQLSNLLPYLQSIFFDPVLRQEVTVGVPILTYHEYFYIFIKPDNFISNFFVVINDFGQTLSIRFSEDILTKEVDLSENAIKTYRLNGTEISSTFHAQLEAAIDILNPTSSLKATLIGAKTGVDGSAKYAAARVLTSSQNQFYILLESIPNMSSSLLSDFNLVVAADPTSVFPLFSYDSKLNSLIIDGSIISLDGYGYGSSNTQAPTVTLTTVPVFDEINVFDPSQFSTVHVSDPSGIEPGQLLYQAFPSENIFDPTTILTAVITDIDGYVLHLTPAQVITLGTTPKISSDPFTHFWSTERPAYILSEVVDPTEYILGYTTSKAQRISIIVDGTLDIRGATPETSVLFTSAAGSLSAPGDWEGIIFTTKSDSNNAGTFKQSNLNHARIRFANTGINIQSSNASVQNCIVRDCLSSGIAVTSSLRQRNQYTQNDYQLIDDKFLPENRLGFLAEDQLRIARFPIQGNLVTANGNLPLFKQKLTEKRYVVDFAEDVDATVYVKSQPVSAITTSPASTTIDHSLRFGEDYLFEFDIDSGYSLVFLYTHGSNKLVRTKDLVSALDTLNLSTTITMNVYFARENGELYSNLIFNTDVGIAINSLATCFVNKNTIDNTRLGISSQNSISKIRNNLVTGFSSAGIVCDTLSLLVAQRNDIFSSKVEDSIRSGVAQTDLLLKSIGPLITNLRIRTPSKFQVGMIIQIDDEQMLVQAQADEEIVVARGQNNTTFTSHDSGSIISIFQLNTIFTVTGIDGDSCTLIQTDELGTPVAASIPIEMQAVAANTFRASLPINRRVNFYYRYKYSTIGNSFAKQTEVKVFQKSQPGIGVNDIVTIYHELPLTLMDYTPNMENICIDPLYINISTADYSYLPTTSRASSQHPSYGSLVEKNPSHRYVGYTQEIEEVVLVQNDTKVLIKKIPLIDNTVSAEVLISRVGSNGAIITLIPSSFSTAVSSNEADQGFIGFFILQGDQVPTSATAGTFSVQYRAATDLGSSLPPYYINTSISYIFDVKSPVSFDNLSFTKDAIGGDVIFTVRIADSLADLTNTIASISTNSSPTTIAEIEKNNTGRVIQVDIALAGNDSSYTPQLLYEFPILQDFTLSFTPAKDSTLYTILALTYNQVDNTTSVLLDAPISNNTYNNVGTDATIEVFARKRADNFDSSLEFITANAAGIAVGDTAIEADGDLTRSKPDASVTDVIRVDYMSYASGEETLYFTSEGSQITGNYYGSIDSITSTFTRDSQFVLPTIETVAIEAVSQPSSGSTYQVSYKFEAPLDGEVLNITYAYNKTIREASQNVLNQSSLFTDAQVRQATTVAVTIGVTLIIEPGIPPLPVQTAVANAITQLFNNFIDITSIRTLNDSEIVRATGVIAGIQDITITTLSRNGLLGEVADLVFVQRESPILADGSPRINAIQNQQIVTLGSE